MSGSACSDRSISAVKAKKKFSQFRHRHVEK